MPAIQNSTNGIVVAVASRDIDKARAFARRFSIPIAFGGYEELVASRDIDGIYIALPNSQHVEWTLKAVEAGKHVLCEKPIAMRAEEILTLIEAGGRTRRLVSEAFAVYYHPQWAKVRELVQGGAIGRLRLVQGAYSYFLDDPKNPRNQLSLGGGAAARRRCLPNPGCSLGIRRGTDPRTS